MKASKIVHKNENRIKIEFPYNREIATKLRQIPDARWSKTHTAWHIPCNKPAFDLLKQLFPEIEHTQQLLSDETGSDQSLPVSLKSPITHHNQKPEGVSVVVLGRKIVIILPKNEADKRFILGLRYSRWDGKQYC